jgi:hypothetical protein
MVFETLKIALLALVLVHAVRAFLDERARSQPAEIKAALTQRQRACLLAKAVFKAAARVSPIGYYGLELLDCLVG